MTDLVCEASPINRKRSTKVEVEARRTALLDIIEDQQPMTVRQVFYQATVRDLVEKTEAGYTKVQVDLTLMPTSFLVRSNLNSIAALRCHNPT
jgi:hypothetical protein